MKTFHKLYPKHGIDAKSAEDTVYDSRNLYLCENFENHATSR